MTVAEWIAAVREALKAQQAFYALHAPDDAPASYYEVDSPEGAAIVQPRYAGVDDALAGAIVAANLPLAQHRAPPDDDDAVLAELLALVRVALERRHRAPPPPEPVPPVHGALEEG